MVPANKKGQCVLFATANAIDCISILSVDRGSQKYVYRTLQNVLEAIPENIPINVYVGNEHTEYLQPATLRKYLPEQSIMRIHIIEFPPEEVCELSTLPLSARARRNYARVLSDYNGTKGLLVLEDDIDLHSSILQDLSILTSHIPTDAYIMTLYTGVRKDDTSEYTIQTCHHGFSCTQGMYYTANCTDTLGAFVRTCDQHYDLAIWEFCLQSSTPLYWVSPSLVQHEGLVSTGLGGVHTAPSFRKHSSVQTVRARL